MSQISDTIDIQLLVRKLHESDEPIVFEFDGKQYALIRKEDLDYYQELEDANDIRAADQALEDMHSNDEKPIPYDHIRKEIGLEE